MMGMVYFCNCVGWDRADVHTEGGLRDMIDDAISISRDTFLQHVDRGSLREVEDSLGYEQHPSRGLTMAGDWHVSYHRSKLHGERVYYFRHSGIEYVFVPEDYENKSNALRRSFAEIVAEAFRVTP